MKIREWFGFKKKEVSQEDLIATIEEQHEEISEICRELDRLTDDLMCKNRKLIKQAKELGLM